MTHLQILKSGLQPELTFNLMATAAKVASFRNLPRGWHYGDGVPASEETAQTAKNLLLGMAHAGLWKTNAFPGIDGQMMVTAYHRNQYFEMSVEADGSVVFVYEENRREVIYRENLTPAEALNLLHEVVRDSLWVSSASYTTTISTRFAETLRAMLSKTRLVKAESQSLTRSALEEAAETSALTSPAIIRYRPMTLLSSGASPTMPYRPNAELSSKTAHPATTAITTFTGFPTVLLDEQSSMLDQTTFEFA